MKKLRGFVLILSALGLAAVVFAQVPPGGYTALYTNKNQTVTATHTFSPATGNMPWAYGPSVTCVPDPGVANVRCYGATGDGATDDLSAFQAAFTAGANKVVRIPAGVYRLTGTVHITSATTVLCDTSASSTLRSASATLPTFSIETDDPVIIRGCRFSVTTGTAKTAGGHIRLAGATPTSSNVSSEISGCTFRQYWIGVDFYAAYGTLLSRNDFFSALANSTAVFLDNFVNPDQGDDLFMGNSFDTSGGGITNGIYQSGSGGLKLIGNKFLNLFNQYRMDIRAGVSTSGLTITGNNFDGNATNHIYLGNSGGGLSNLLISGNNFQGGGTGIVITDHVEDGIISAATFMNMTTGIHVVMGADWQITGVFMQDVTTGILIDPDSPGVNNARIRVSGLSAFSVPTPFSSATGRNGPSALYGFPQVTGKIPTLAGCGTSPGFVGSDAAGHITIGGGGASSCVLTFSTPEVVAPVCLAQDETPGKTVQATATGGSLTLSGTLGAGEQVDYLCLGLFG